jgi:L-2,4-diaminobutyric acid acetyltransferase
LMLHQIEMTNSKYFEGSVNPSNEASKRNFVKLAELLDANCEEKLLFALEDFENDGHEAEVLYRIGPISQVAVRKKLEMG